MRSNIRLAVPCFAAATFLTIIVLAWGTDTWFHRLKEREKQEEIDLYGEYMDIEATPVDDDIDVELEELNDDDDDDDGGSGKGGDKDDSSNNKKGNDDDDLFT